jgi:hypothetical protein
MTGQRIVRVSHVLIRAMSGCARVALLSCLIAASAAAAQVPVPAGGDLQGAINAAQPGDVLLLEPGATYVGNFRLPVTPGTAFITIRTNGASVRLPGAGVRIGPEFADVLGKIKSPNTAPALATADGANHWRIELVEFQANLRGSGDIIVLGGAGSQTQRSQMPHDLVFDRVYIHGDPVAGQKRGIALNSGRTEILNSYIADIKGVGFETQAICGWNGSGPYIIENNYLEAAGVNLLFGGADPSVPDLVAADIVVRRNLFSKPLAWRSERWAVKNAFELKNARRVLIEGNIFENVWRDAQPGFAVLFTVRNQNGRAPWATIEDVTFRHNIIRHAGGGINITGYDDNHPSQQTQRLLIAHNVIHDIDGGTWGGNGHGIQIGNAPRDVTIEHNTVLQTGQALALYGSRNGAPWPVEGLVMRNNLMRHSTYGVKGDGVAVGQASLFAYASPWVFEHNALAGGTASRYPAGNLFPTVAEFEAAFVDMLAENFALVSASPFRTAATNGAALGADVSRVLTAINGAPAPSAPGGAGPSDSDREAICRTGLVCNDLPFFLRRR